MPQKVTIDCGEGKNAYQVELTVADLEAFYKAESSPAVAGKRGEDRVKALLAASDNSILCLGRLKNGKETDGPKGEYAIELFYKSGKLECQARYQNRVQTDGPNGEAAALHFHENGKLACVAHYQNNLPHDGANGDPATMTFTKKGRLSFVVFHEGNETTVLEFSKKGALVCVEQHEYNELVKKLNKEERADYAEQFKDKIAGFFALADKLQNGCSATPGSAAKPAAKM